MKRRIYIYQDKISEEIVDLFNSFGDQIVVEQLQNDILTVLDNDYYNPEPIDLVSFQELIEEDFGGEVTIFIEPYLDDDFILGPMIRDFITLLPHGVFCFEDIITYAVIKHQIELQNHIKAYIQSKANQEVIYTVKEFIENDLNSTKSAKKLYMHRNTLNYRIDHFIESTNINVKTFKGANAIYMLYKY